MILVDDQRPSVRVRIPAIHLKLAESDEVQCRNRFKESIVLLQLIQPPVFAFLMGRAGTLNPLESIFRAGGGAMLPPPT